MRSATNTIANISGGAAATGGLMSWLSEHASALGILISAATLLVYLVSMVLTMWLKRQEHLATMSAIEKKASSSRQRP